MIGSLIFEHLVLIYVSLDLRRALWVPEATGAMVVCSYASDLLPWMRKKGNEIWCFQEQFPEDPLPQSTSELLGNPKTLKWLRSLGKNLTFLVFKPANRIRQFIENEGWKLISPEVEVCRQLEDKVSFFDLAQKYDLTIPRSEIVLWDEAKVEEYHQQFGDPLIVQERMGHAGSCTHVVRGGKPVAELKNGTRVKLSEFISGPTYTFNGYVSPGGKLVVSRLYQQLMDVPQWNEFEMGTVGISPELHLSREVYEQLRELLLKMVPLFQEVKYSGFFGLDLIWNGKKWYLIECNPRFTASISLQCLTDVTAEFASILKLHAEQAEPVEHEFRFLQKFEDRPTTPNPLQGENPSRSSDAFGHIVLRNSKNRAWQIPRTLKSGIYKKDLEGKWAMRVRSYDANELEDGEVLLILAHEPGATIEPGSDFGGLQYKGSAYVDGKIDDRFFDFFDRVVMGHLIRAKDFWEEKYIQIEGGVHEPRLHVAVFSKPSVSSQMSTEVLGGETIKLLGEYGEFFFVERSDGTRGWISSSIAHQPSSAEHFSFPNRSTLTTEQFFDHWLGKPYLYGGNSEQGIDCSAFVQRYFWEVKGILLPKNSQDQKAACSQEIEQKDLQNDDLVFLRHKETKIPHVGISWSGKIWHSGISQGVGQQELEQMLEKYDLEAFKRL